MTTLMRIKGALREPSSATVKRLYQGAGGQCAFPECKNALFDRQTGACTSRVCHVNGSNPGSARYDPQQTAADRHGYDNLVLMCSIHSDVIDHRPMEPFFTAKQIREWKAHVEAAVTIQPPVTREIAYALMGRTTGVSQDQAALIASVWQRNQGAAIASASTSGANSPALAATQTGENSRLIQAGTYIESAQPRLDEFADAPYPKWLEPAVARVLPDGRLALDIDCENTSPKDSVHWYSKQITTDPPDEPMDTEEFAMTVPIHPFQGDPLRRFTFKIRSTFPAMHWGQRLVMWSLTYKGNDQVRGYVTTGSAVVEFEKSGHARLIGEPAWDRTSARHRHELYEQLSGTRRSAGSTG
jgi:hypothetical protein